jgi:2-(1,2-epoxy-1,2-dihydrophenyl)acetyl-CoA isomerase
VTEQTDTSPVRYAVSDGVATVTLNRPEAMNSLDWETKTALRDAVQRAAEDEAVRCVVLTGSGKAFCVGQDLKEHIGLIESGSDRPFKTVEEHYNPTVRALATMDKPVVAAVNGIAAGAGASLAFACDFRIVAESAGFNTAFTGVALSCDTGASWTLPRLVGRSKALELLYFPRTVPAQEALELGLATSVVAATELPKAVADLTQKLANGPTVAYGSVRRAVAYSAVHDLDASLEFEGTMMDRTGATKDHAQAVAAFVAKEKPVFEGR